MTDQRIHLFKVFRGSSKAKAKKILSSSFISKSPSVDALFQAVPGIKTQNLQNTLLRADNPPTKQQNNQTLTTLQAKTNSSGNITTYKQQESLKFIYHEEDTQQSSRIQGNTQLQELKIQQSSIQIQESSAWIDLQKGSPSFSQQIQFTTKFIMERKIIEEERFKLQREKNQLDRKKKEVEELMVQFSLMRKSCSDREDHSTPKKIVQKIEELNANNRPRLKKRNTLGACQSLNSQKGEFLPKSKEQKMDQQLKKIEETHQLIRKQKARQALILETLWINLIRTNNQIRSINNCHTREVFSFMKKTYRVTKFCELIQSGTCVLDLMVLGQAFFRIKKANASNWRAPTIRKNIIIRFNKGQSKENIPLEYETQRKREKKLETQMTARQNIKSFLNKPSQNNVLEIDSIIKAQINKAKEAKRNDKQKNSVYKSEENKKMKSQIKIQVNVEMVDKIKIQKKILSQSNSTNNLADNRILRQANPTSKQPFSFKKMIKR